MDPSERTYAEAMAEVEAIMQSMEDGQIEIDDLAAKVERASALIAECRARLRKATTEVEKSLEALREAPVAPASPSAPAAGTRAQGPATEAARTPSVSAAAALPGTDDEVDPFADI